MITGVESEAAVARHREFLPGHRHRGPLELKMRVESLAALAAHLGPSAEPELARRTTAIDSTCCGEEKPVESVCFTPTNPPTHRTSAAFSR